VSTSYQRGNRDGLLDFAARLDARAKTYEDEADEYEAQLNRGRYAKSEMHRGVATRMHLLAHEIRQVAEEARRASESLPEDPEEGP